MIPLAEPYFEATVSLQLVALLFEKGAAEQKPSASFDAASENHSSEAQFETVILRRDGDRPLVFEGLPLWEEEATLKVDRSKNGEIETTLRIFLSKKKRLVVQIVYKPCDSLPARPVHRAMEIGHEFDLLALLAETCPVLCFAVSPSFPREAVSHFAEMGNVSFPIRSLWRPNFTTS